MGLRKAGDLYESIAGNQKRNQILRQRRGGVQGSGRGQLFHGAGRIYRHHGGLRLGQEYPAERHRPSSGEILLEGQTLAERKERELAAFRRDRLGFIFQDYNLLDTLTVEENIVLPLNLRKTPAAETRQRLREVASSLEITDQLSKFPRQLSGGQRQRAACARALITDPALILADEPTGALDSANSKGLMQTFTRMNRDLGSTILMVTHDAVVGSYASRVLFLKDGKIWNELYRGSRDRGAMYREILDVFAVLGGEADVR